MNSVRFIFCAVGFGLLTDGVAGFFVQFVPDGLDVVEIFVGAGEAERVINFQPEFF